MTERRRTPRVEDPDLASLNRNAEVRGLTCRRVILLGQDDRAASIARRAARDARRFLIRCGRWATTEYQLPSNDDPQTRPKMKAYVP